MNPDAEKLPNLVKYLSLCGASSRRAAEELIRNGRVAVDQNVEKNPARRINPSETVSLDGKQLHPPEKFHYIMLNKPRGYVCSNSDAHAVKLAVELIRIKSGGFLRSAGRLDKDSEGLIIFSDDGSYLERAAHPRHGVTKRYVVSVNRPLTDGELRGFEAGIRDNGEVLRAIAVSRIDECKYLFKLNEGKKREIRRLCASVGAEVKRLKRISFGDLELGALPPGAFRELDPREVQRSLSSDAKL